MGKARWPGAGGGGAGGAGDVSRHATWNGSQLLSRWPLV